VNLFLPALESDSSVPPCGRGELRNMLRHRPPLSSSAAITIW